VVVILEQLTGSHEVEDQCVLGIVNPGGFEVAIAVFVTTPVDDSTLDWANQVVNGEQEEKHPVWSVENIKKRVQGPKENFGEPSSTEIVDQWPIRGGGEGPVTVPQAPRLCS